MCGNEACGYEIWFAQGRTSQCCIVRAGRTRKARKRNFYMDKNFPAQTLDQPIFLHGFFLLSARFSAYAMKFCVGVCWFKHKTHSSSMFFRFCPVHKSICIFSHLMAHRDDEEGRMFHDHHASVQSSKIVLPTIFVTSFNMSRLCLPPKVNLIIYFVIKQLHLCLANNLHDFHPFLGALCMN